MGWNTLGEKSCVLGIDIGTTSVKVVAFASDNSIVSQAQAELELMAVEDTGAEQDPVKAYDTLMDVMHRVWLELSAEGYTIGVVGFSAAMHSLMVVSPGNTPLSNVLTWVDGRAHREAEKVWGTEEGRALYRDTGTPIHPMSPMIKLFWMRRHKPDLFQSAAKYVSLKEWIWYQWFRVWEIDESMASATGLLNLSTRQWDDCALQYVGVNSNQFSQVVPTDFVRKGCVDARMQAAGITSDTLFNIGASDGVLANLGVGAVTKGTLALTMGTSIAVRLLSEKPQTHDEIRSFCYILDNERYIIGGPSNSGGIVLDWVYTSLLQSKLSMTDAIEEAGTTDIDGLFCFPYISGERAPLWDSNARASFVGLDLRHSSLHMLRAAIEGVLFNAYWIASELFAQVGRPNVLIASGRLFEVKWVRQLLADVFNIPVKIDALSDASILGAVRLARRAAANAVVPTATSARMDEVGIRPAKSNLDEPGETLHPHQQLKYDEKFKEFRRLAAVLYS